jgi:UDP-3-O-[3-hydroxymyristoyl] glucosamine N-acyltransferase
MLSNFDSNKPLYVIGQGHSAHELAEFIQRDPTVDVTVIDVGKYFELQDYAQCLIGFQNIEYRVNFINRSKNLLRCWPSYVHPLADICQSSSIGKGVVIGPQTCIGHSVKLQDFCYISPFSLIGHGSVLGNNFVCSPGVIVGGSSIVGDNVFVGLSSCIRDKISVCNDVTFQMTSVVTKSITESGTYYGNKKIPVDSDKHYISD